MSHEVIVTAEGSRLVGKLPADAEAIMDLEGGTFRAVLTTPSGRSLSQTALWFVVCQMIADNFDGYILSKDQVDQILRIECGHTTIWKDAAVRVVSICEAQSACGYAIIRATPQSPDSGGEG